MSSNESLGAGNTSEPWCEELGTYEQSDGTYVALEATETGNTFAVPENTGFSFLDGPEEQN